MNKVLLVAGVALLVGSVLFLNYNQHQSVDINEESAQNFFLFKINLNKQYSSVSEESYRLAIYTQNMKEAQAHNADPANTWTMGETQFSDLTQQEFAAIYLTQQSQTEEVVEVEAKVDPNCQPVDWRQHDGVARQVKDQGRCGSHWAFSAVGAVEAYHAVVRGQRNLDLSEQQLIDCSRQRNEGCNGGSSEEAINYISREGLTNQQDYPYTGNDEYECYREGGEYRVNNAQKVKVCPIALQQAIKSRPVSVGVDASNWRQYTGGVLTNCGNQVNHGVLAYGYDMGSWLLKNSWGTQWGQAGFIKIRMGNTCNVLSQAYLAA